MVFLAVRSNRLNRSYTFSASVQEDNIVHSNTKGGGVKINNDCFATADNRRWYFDPSYRFFFSDGKIKLLILAGPSGSGKSTCADFIERNYPFKRLRMQTTRKKRKDVTEIGTYGLTKTDFEKKIRRNEFFLYRTDLEPYYGYSKTDLQTIFDRGEIPILMFRNHGIDFISEQITDFHVIFIDCDSRQCAIRSKSQIPVFTVDNIEKVLEKNRLQIERLQSYGLGVSTLYNNYDRKFFSDICHLSVLAEASCCANNVEFPYAEFRKD